MLTVIAIIKPKSGYEYKIKQGLAEIAKLSRRENGCNEYLVYESSENPGELVTYEKYQSKEALDSHMKSNHVQVFLKNNPEDTFSGEMKVLDSII